jgi:hypothetical protein
MEGNSILLGNHKIAEGGREKVKSGGDSGKM